MASPPHPIHLLEQSTAILKPRFSITLATPTPTLTFAHCNSSIPAHPLIMIRALECTVQAINQIMRNKHAYGKPTRKEEEEKRANWNRNWKVEASDEAPVRGSTRKESMLINAAQLMHHGGGGGGGHKKKKWSVTCKKPSEASSCSCSCSILHPPPPPPPETTYLLYRRRKLTSPPG
ncbi:hypothetical protein DFH27DRAFT_526500 [Peziza echinospora]|nr:hypothetical protein DFH27DRAFT_526500 [Peziza echinospora]